MKARIGAVAAMGRQAAPRSDRIVLPLQPGVCRALRLADLVGAAGARWPRGCAGRTTGHDNPPQVAEDTMPTDMPAPRNPEKIKRGGALATPRQAR